MEIDIDNFRITSDDRNFILQEKKKADKDTKSMVKGEIYYTDLGYYGKLIHVINSLLTLKIKRSNITTLEELKREVIKQRDYIKKQIGDI